MFGHEEQLSAAQTNTYTLEYVVETYRHRSTDTTDEWMNRKCGKQ